MPGGRPKGSTNNPFKKQLMLSLSRAEGDISKLRRIADNLVDAGVKGEPWAIKEIADRVDGKPKQAITGPEGGPVQFMDLSNVSDEQLAKLQGLVESIASSSDTAETDTAGEATETGEGEATAGP